jgi:PPOX class probable F420-dependent enzyme
MTKMNENEIKNFLMQGTLTGKLATISEDGRPHVAPIWFVLDGNDLILTTHCESVKAKNMLRDPRIAICVDDQTPLFSFVTIFGIASTDKNSIDLLKWTIKIAERYMGKDKANDYGKRNSTEEELVVRIKPTKIIAEKEVAAWE